MPPKKKCSKRKHKEAEKSCSTEFEDHDDTIQCLEQLPQEESEPLALQKKRRQNLNFSDDQETELVEWLKNHPIFYNKGSKEYKDTQKSSVFGRRKHMKLMYLVNILTQIEYSILVSFVVTTLLSF